VGNLGAWGAVCGTELLACWSMLTLVGVIIELDCRISNWHR
jgi:hypothetical protein